MLHAGEIHAVHKQQHAVRTLCRMWQESEKPAYFVRRLHVPSNRTETYPDKVTVSTRHDRTDYWHKLPDRPALQT